MELFSESLPQHHYDLLDQYLKTETNVLKFIQKLKILNLFKKWNVSTIDRMRQLTLLSSVVESIFTSSMLDSWVCASELSMLSLNMFSKMLIGGGWGTTSSELSSSSSSLESSTTTASGSGCLFVTCLQNEYFLFKKAYLWGHGLQFYLFYKKFFYNLWNLNLLKVMSTFLTMDAFVWPKHLQESRILVRMIMKIFVPYVGSSIYLPMCDLTDNCFLAEIYVCRAYSHAWP